MVLPSFKVLEFETKFHLNEKTGKRDRAVDWVLVSNINGAAQTWHRVKDLDPSEAKFGEGQSGWKSDMEQAFLGRWSVIEPKYEHWKKGAELPEEGSALASWPFLSADEVRAFIAAGIKTIEEVAAMNDAAMGRVAVPAIRNKRKAAQQFIENADKVTMQAQIAHLQKQLAELSAPTDKPEKQDGKTAEKEPEYKHYAGREELVVENDGQTAAPSPEEILATSTPSPDAPKRRGRPRKDAA